MSQPLRLQNPFVGREREQQAYRQMLAQTIPWMLSITGDGGIGKSALLRHLAENTPQDITVVALNFANEALRTDPLKILEELSWRLAADCDSVKVDAFEKSLQEGRDRLSELSRQMSQTVIVGDAASLKDAQLSMSGVDGAAAREQRRQVREMVTKALYTQALTFQSTRLVIMLDTCEWLSEPEGLEVGHWVVDGEVSALAEKALMDAYMEANTPTTSTIILNFSGLEYMNSSGIGLLVTLLIRVNHQEQRLLAFGLSQHYRSIFEITRLNEAIEIYDTETQTLASLHAS